MVVLDTDVLTLMQRRQGDRFAHLAERIGLAGEEIYVTIVPFEEQMRGWLAACAKARTPERYAIEAARLHEMILDFGNWEVLRFDDRCASEFKRLASHKVRIGTMDLRIASIVLVHDATLITMNRRDYAKVPGLRVEDWTRR